MFGKYYTLIAKLTKTFIGVIILPYLLLWEVVKTTSIRLFCNHDWRYWNVKLNSKRQGIDGTVLRRWRRCEKCDKQQKLNMIPGNWNWERSNRLLPEDTDTVEVDVRLMGEPESKSDRRDKIIDKILKK